MTDPRIAVDPSTDDDPHVHAHAGHAHSPNMTMSRRTIRLTLAALIPAALLTLAGLFMLWPDGTNSAEPWSGPKHAVGEVRSVHRTPCPELPEGTEVPGGAPQVCGEAAVLLDSGAQITTGLPAGPGAPVLAAGDRVITIETESFDEPGVLIYEVIDHERSSALWALLLTFVLTVVAFGRLRGVMALVSLAVTFAILLMFVVPAILDGKSPLWVAIVGSAAIMLVVLYLTHGITIPTSMAVLGTLTSLILTGGLAAFSTWALKLTGVASEESSFLTLQYSHVNMQGLLLAGILIGSLGVLDDVAVTQAYTVTELAHANPSMGFRRLYQAASRVGRAHITSVINTIVLAYAGASLPLLLLLTAGQQPLAEVIKSELLTQEIVRSVVGTIGLIAAVPITTALAALAVGGKSAPGRSSKPPVPDG